MSGLLGACMIVLLAATDGGPAGPAGGPGAGLEPTTQPTAQPASQPSETAGPADAANVKDRVRKLRLESIQPPTATLTASEKLRQTMDELRQFRVSPRPRSKAAIAAAVGAPASRPAEPASRPDAAGDANDLAGGTTRPAVEAGLSKEVVEKLKGIPSAALASPADLADELYQGGHLAAAAAMYERAMVEADADTKAWAMYQTANCRRVARPQEAEALYLRVIGEHPKSPWAQLAAVEQKLMEWHRVNRPLELLDSLSTLGRTPAKGATTRPTTRPTTQPTMLPASAKTQALGTPERAAQPRGGEAAGTQETRNQGTMTVRTKTSSAETQPSAITVLKPEQETVVPRVR